MPSRGLTIVLVGFVALMGLGGANAFLYDLHRPHLYPLNLYLRLGTGLLTGLTFAGFVVPAFNSTVWQTSLDVSPLTSARKARPASGASGTFFRSTVISAKPGQVLKALPTT